MESNKTIRIFSGATAIITGAASGIGRALAKELAQRGCEVVLADRQIELAKEVAATIQNTGAKATAVNLDVTDFNAMEQLVQETVKRTGRLDYMVNNAGITLTGNVWDYKIEDWNLIVDVNLRGIIHGVQATLKIMLDQGFGHIVNMSSMTGLLPIPGNIGYTTTKHGIVGLSKSLRVEVAKRGVRVSVLCPGPVFTPALEGKSKYGKVLINMSPEQQQRVGERIVRDSRPISPEIFAKQAIDLVAKNKAIIVVPSLWKIFWWIDRLFPSAILSLMQKSFQDWQQQLSSE